MGVCSGSTVISSLLWLIGQSRLGQALEQNLTEEGLEPPIIQVQVISNDERADEEFMVLVDTWWKILAWSLAVLTLSCLCCYFSRCCYLCWDCCSDPFWGCCPQSERCSRFLLMKGCCGRSHSRKKRGGYKICEDFQAPQDEETAFTKINSTKLMEEDEDDLSDEDFTLRTVESMEVDAMLSNISPIKGKKPHKNKSEAKVVTSTPRRKKPVVDTNESIKDIEPILLEYSGVAESMPQFYPTHYFNILNIFGVGCSNYKVSSVEESNRKFMTNHHNHHSAPMNLNTNSSSLTTKNEESTIALVSDAEDELLIEDKSFDRSVINNQDFPLSSSFSNMYKKNGLHIEEGQVGRYQPLPEARFELLPPAHFLRKVKRQNSSGGMMHRRSRSMENFKTTNNSNQYQKPSKKYSTGSWQQKEPKFIEDEEEDEESSLPSPPPVPLPINCSRQVFKATTSMMTSQKNGTNYNSNSSTATTDEECFEKSHKRAHSEGSRIGHRRTPSMEGVTALQNGGFLRKTSSNSYQNHSHSRQKRSLNDLPPKAPQSNHKKRHSHKKMQMIDINGEMEKCILYGKETTL